MPWVSFTANHVLSRMSAREAEKYEATAEVDDVSPIIRMAEVVTQVTDSFRGSIRGNPNVSSMGPTGTIPDFCIFSASVIARNSLIALIPVSEGMTDPRRDEQREAERFLRDLRTMGSQAFGEDPPTASAISTASYGGAPLLDF